MDTSELAIPEGLDRHQIADVAKDAKLKGDYEEASKSFKGFDPAEYGAEDAPNLEGFLFPATYELPKKATVKDLISRQLDAFEQNFNEVDLSYAESKNLNAYDVLKIASMIEREVQVEKERPLVAEVIYNRLKAGTPLGIDATIRYYLQNYDEQLTAVGARRRHQPVQLARSHRACRRRRSATPAWRRSRRRPIRPRATSSTSSSSRAPAASTSSPRPRRSSSRPRPSTSRRLPSRAARRPNADLS